MSLQFISPGDGSSVALFVDSATGESGLAIKLLNGTGGNSIKGYLCDASTTTNFAYRHATINELDVFGICLEAGIANGNPTWIATQGKVQVYFSGNTTRGHFARVGATADTGEVDGQAISEAIPSTPFATDNHFREIGHVIEARTGAGLAMCVIHFN